MRQFGTNDLPRMVDGNDGTELSASYFNPIWENLDLRIHDLESLEVDWQAEIENLNKLGLRRLDEVLSPAFRTVEQAAALGFLVAPSDTNITLQIGVEQSIYVKEEYRNLFAPTPWIEINLDDAGPDQGYAYCQVTHWFKDSGELRIIPKSISSITGAHNAWVISASAGIWAKTGQSIADAIAAAPVAVAARDVAIAKAAEAAASALNAQTWDTANYYNKTQVDAKIGDLNSAQRMDWLIGTPTTVFTMPSPYVYIDVYVNGVLIDETTDYTCDRTAGTLTLLTPAAIGDTVKARCIGAYQILSAYTTAQVDTLMAAQQARIDAYINTQWLSPRLVSTTGTTANAFDQIKVDLSTIDITISLPSAPSDNAAIRFYPRGLKTLTIDPNGKTIEGVSGSMACDFNPSSFVLRFSTNLNTWLVES